MNEIDVVTGSGEWGCDRYSLDEAYSESSRARRLLQRSLNGQDAVVNGSDTFVNGSGTFVNGSSYFDAHNHTILHRVEEVVEVSGRRLMLRVKPCSMEDIFEDLTVHMETYPRKAVEDEGDEDGSDEEGGAEEVVGEVVYDGATIDDDGLVHGNPWDEDGVVLPHRSYSVEEGHGRSLFWGRVGHFFGSVFNFGRNIVTYPPPTPPPHRPPH